jgi:hypothetical protein
MREDLHRMKYRQVAIFQDDSHEDLEGKINRFLYDRVLDISLVDVKLLSKSTNDILALVIYEED